MGQIDIQQLRDWAAEYNRDKFIHSDPVQFPQIFRSKRYRDKRLSHSMDFLW